MQAGRADCIIYALIQALSVSAQGADAGAGDAAAGALVALPSAMGVQTEPDRRWRDFLNGWVDYNTGTRQVGALDAAVVAEDGRESGEHPSERRPLNSRAAMRYGCGEFSAV